MNKALLLIAQLFLLCIAFASNNQSFEPHYINLSVKDGLPSNEVYDMLQDSKGRLWFCTDNGLSVFDGQEFERVHDSSYSLIILGGRVDAEGNLWFFTVKSDILRLKIGDDKPELVISGKRLESVMHQQLINSISFIGQDLALSIGNSILLIKNIEAELSYEEIVCDRGEIKVLVDGNECAACHRTYEDSLVNLSIYRRADSLFFEKIVLGNEHTKHWVSAQFSQTNELLIHTSKSILKINIKTGNWIHINSLKANTSGLYIDGDLIWIGSADDGLRAYSKKDLSKKKHYYKGFAFSNYSKDKDGGVWLCSQESGVYYIPYPSLMSYKVNNSLPMHISALSANHEGVYFGQYKGNIGCINFSDSSLVLKEIGKITGQILDIREHISNPKIHFLSGSDYLIYDPRNNQVTNSSVIERDFYGNIIGPIPKAIVNHGKNVLLYSPQNEEYNLLESDYNFPRIRKQFETPSAIYFGGFSNSYSYLKASKRTREIKDGTASIDMRCGASIGNGLTAIGTKGNGVLILKEDSIVEKLNFKDPRLNTVIDLIYQNHSLWIVCPDGFFEFDELSRELLDWSALFLSNRPAFQGIEKFRGQFLLASDRNFFYFNPDSISISNRGPEIYQIEYLHNNSFNEFENSELELSELNSSFSLFPKSVSFVNLFNHRYRFRLLPNDSNWTETKSNVIPFNALKHGEYKLEIQAGDGLNNWSSAVTSLKLSILPVFYKSFSFYLIVLLILSLVILLLYKWQIRQVKARNQLELQISDARNKALSVQLNPHFIFNSLNSINAYLAQNDSKSAMRFLGKFAKMMRNTFDNSQQTYISLDEELKAIERYIEIEKIRLENKFDFNIDIEDGINVYEFKSPSLLLQPFVENSIWHGILPLKDRRGKIDIKVQKGTHANELLITIDDNGVGKRDKPYYDKLDSKRKKSTAIIKERFEALEKLTKQVHSVNIVNRKDSKGTRVILKFATQIEQIKL